MPTCPNCRGEILNSSPIQVSNQKLLSNRFGFQIPFRCVGCNSIQFKYQAFRDVVFLYPVPRPEKIGSIYLPDYDGRTHNTQEYFRSPIGVILSAGEGAYDKIGKWHPSEGIEVGDAVLYNKHVPWKMEIDGHNIVICGYKDLYTIIPCQNLIELGMQMLLPDRQPLEIQSRR